MRLTVVLLVLTGSAWAGNVVPDCGDVRLTGPFGERMDAMIRNHVERTDVELLTACFSERNETRQIWQCEFWGKYMHAAAPFATYTGSVALREKLDRGAARVIAAQSSDGYIGNYPGELRFGNRGWNVWGVKYTLIVSRGCPRGVVSEAGGAGGCGEGVRERWVRDEDGVFAGELLPVAEHGAASGWGDRLFDARMAACEGGGVRTGAALHGAAACGVFLRKSYSGSFPWKDVL